MSIEMTPGEAIDRYTILRLKKLRGTTLSEMEHKELQAEIDRYRKGIAHWEKAFGLMDELFETNKRIWDLEADMRSGVEMEMEERGLRSIKIRDLNRDRVQTRNRIDRMFGAYAEPKVLHASAAEGR